VENEGDRIKHAALMVAATWNAQAHAGIVKRTEQAGNGIPFWPLWVVRSPAA